MATATLAGPKSERKAWRNVATWALEIAHSTDPAARGISKRLHDLSREMLAQVAGGIHRNPLLAVYNPAGKRSKGKGSFEFARHIASDVHDLRYSHVADGKDYRHPFEGGVEMFGIVRGPGTGGRQQRDLLLTDSDGKPLWDDFK